MIIFRRPWVGIRKAHSLTLVPFFAFHELVCGSSAVDLGMETTQFPTRWPRNSYLLVPALAARSDILGTRRHQEILLKFFSSSPCLWTFAARHGSMGITEDKDEDLGGENTRKAGSCWFMDVIIHDSESWITYLSYMTIEERRQISHHVEVMTSRKLRLKFRLW